MKTMFAAASAAALLAAAPALAQDAPAPDRTQGEITFTGFRAEGRVGYSHQNVTVFTDAEADALGVPDRDFGSDAVQLGVGVGYDLAVGPLVAGVEAGIDWSLGESRLEFADQQINSKIGYGRDIEVGGRLGFRAGNNVLVYGKGGYTNLRVNARGTGIIADGPDADQLPDELRFGGRGNLDGWRVGGGAELALPAGFLGGAAYAKAEYRHSEYEGDVSKDEGVLALGFRF